MKSRLNLKLRFANTGLFAAALGMACLCATAAYAQQPEPIKRTALQKVAFPGDAMTTVLVAVDVVPNGLVAHHTHPGVEMLYLLEGNVDLTIDGQPTRQLKPGDSAVTLPGIAHTGKAGPNGAKLIATYVVETGKPLASPAP